MLFIWEVLIVLKDGAQKLGRFQQQFIMFDIGWAITKGKLKNIAFEPNLLRSSLGSSGCPQMVGWKNLDVSLMIYFLV